MHGMALLIFWLWAAPVPLDPAAQVNTGTELLVRFVANEGVLLQAGNTKVIIDGLFRKEYPQFSALEGDTRRAAETAQGVFADIQLILATHQHADHFSAASVASYLNHNAAAIFLGTPQTLEQLQKEEAYVQLKDRIHALPWVWKQAATFPSGQVKVTILPLKHGGRFKSSMQNHAFIVELGGYRILHIGDADTGQDNFEWANIKEKDLDVAVIPFWFFNEADRQVLETQLPARQVYAAHIPPAQLEAVRKDLAENFPSVILLESYEKVFTLSPR